MLPWPAEQEARAVAGVEVDAVCRPRRGDVAQREVMLPALRPASASTSLFCVIRADAGAAAGEDRGLDGDVDVAVVRSGLDLDRARRLAARGDPRAHDLVPEAGGDEDAEAVAADHDRVAELQAAAAADVDRGGVARAGRHGDLRELRHAAARELQRAVDGEAEIAVDLHVRREVRRRVGARRDVEDVTRDGRRGGLDEPAAGEVAPAADAVAAPSRCRSPRAPRQAPPAPAMLRRQRSTSDDGGPGVTFIPPKIGATASLRPFSVARG